MKASIVIFAAAVGVWSPRAGALTPDLAAKLAEVGQNMQTEKALLDKTVESVRQSIAESHADEPGPSDNNRIIGELTVFRSSVQSMADFMHANDVQLRAEDRDFDAHLGKIDADLQDIDGQLNAARNRHYFRRVHRRIRWTNQH